MLKNIGIEKGKPSSQGKAWFPYFRLYSSKKAFLDHTWVLLDIEKMK